MVRTLLAAARKLGINRRFEEILWRGVPLAAVR